MKLETAHVGPLCCVAGAQYPWQKALVKCQARQPLSQGAHTLSPGLGGRK